MQTKEQYIQELLDRYDADELVDVLNISARELITRFEDRIDIILDDQEDDDDEDE